MSTIFIKERKILEDNTIEEFILKGYYGGRCEAFAVGEFQNINYYDVNSLYPTMMLNKFPIPQSIKKGHNNIKDIINYMGITECSVECPLNMSIPILPLRKDDGKIIYPTGKFKGVWTNEILKYAIENDYKVTDITRQYIYTECYELFKSYVTTLYDLRKEYKLNKNSEEQTIKLLMNSLYGKFAQKPSDIYEIIQSNEETNNKVINKKMNSGYDVQVSNDRKFFICSKTSNKYPRNSFPILSAYVTSYGQIHLHKLLKTYKPLYCDTDSLMTCETLPDNLIDQTELGKLKLEKHGTVELSAPKMYAFNHVPTMKGINLRNFKDEEKYNIFKNYIKGKAIPQERFIKLKSALRSVKGYTPNEIITMYKKKKIVVSDKRIFIDKYSIPIEVTL